MEPKVRERLATRSPLGEHLLVLTKVFSRNQFGPSLFNYLTGKILDERQFDNPPIRSTSCRLELSISETNLESSGGNPPEFFFVLKALRLESPAKDTKKEGDALVR